MAAIKTMSMLSRYQASMVLSGVGDAFAYKQGDWEFCHSGEAIYKEVTEMGGVEKIKVKLPMFPVSDDTVLHLATAEALVKASGQEDKEKLYLALADSYQKGMKDMSGRAPGATTSFAAAKLRPMVPKGYCIPFNERGGGCGAAMRSMCIGLRYPRPEDVDDLIAVSIESGRMTHNNPTGYLGSLASALFTSFAIQERPLREWGAGLMTTLPKAQEYIKSVGRDVEENIKAWAYFETHWGDYLKFRKIEDGQSDPVFTENDESMVKRDALYKSWSFSGWGGSSGHDAPMIAYDALLGAGSSWLELCKRGLFHSGDSDSTGVIAGACFGAMYGLDGVPEPNHKRLEYKDRMLKLAGQLLEMTQSQHKSQQ